LGCPPIDEDELGDWGSVQDRGPGPLGFLFAGWDKKNHPRGSVLRDSYLPSLLKVPKRGPGPVCMALYPAVSLILSVVLMDDKQLLVGGVKREPRARGTVKGASGLWVTLVSRFRPCRSS
jgi:hypothetical protein